MKHEHRHDTKMACPGRAFKPAGQAATFWPESTNARLTQTRWMPISTDMLVHAVHFRFLLLNRLQPRAV